MLFKISLRNIKKSMKDYAVYFFTLIVGVSVFYIFNAIETQSAMMKVSASTKEIIKLMTTTLSGVSVFVSFILGFLIIYASRFLMKRRNKEFGLYLLLGMGKRKVSMILFFETLLVGLISLGVGLLIGAGLSQVMSVFVANMFEADMTEFAFVFSKGAAVRTVLYFSVMYVVVMIFNTFSISKCKLLDLLQAGKRSEQVKMKNPWLCTFVFLLSAAVLGAAYYMVTAKARILTADQLMVPIAMGIVSTFFIFWSVSGLLLRIVMSCKKLYFKGLNSFVLRQMSSKINTMVFSVTIICLMLFITICVLASAFCIKNSMNSNLNELAPADLELTQKVNLADSGLTEMYSETQLANSNMSILDVYRACGIDIEADLAEYVSVYEYGSGELTFATSLGACLDEVMEEFRFLNYDTPETILKVSDYNRVAQLYGKETYTLAKDEYIVLADFDSMVAIRNKVLSTGQTIEIFGRTLKPKYKECQDGFLEMSSNHINTGIYLLPDEVVPEEVRVREYLIANYRADTREEKQAIEDKANSLADAEHVGNYMPIDGTSRITISEMSLGLGALVTFIGLYLGIIFLISGAAILALKELSESADNVQRFSMLRKLGADEKMIRRALFRQIGIFFLLPLLLACVHSVFGMMLSNTILETLGNEQMLPSLVITGVLVVAIYGGYFLLTYICSKNIIKER